MHIHRKLVLKSPLEKPTKSAFNKGNVLRREELLDNGDGVQLGLTGAETAWADGARR